MFYAVDPFHQCNNVGLLDALNTSLSYDRHFSGKTRGFDDITRHLAITVASELRKSKSQNSMHSAV